MPTMLHDVGARKSMAASTNTRTASWRARRAGSTCSALEWTSTRRTRARAGAGIEVARELAATGVVGKTVEAVILALLLILAVLLWLHAAPTTSTYDPFGSWLLATSSLWIATCPAWIFRPIRYRLKTTIVGGAIAFAVIGGAVLVGLAIDGQTGNEALRLR